MQIVFWSCMPGHAAVSSSMLSLACSCGAYQRYNTAVLQLQYKKNNIQYPFFKMSDKENVEQFNSAGMDALIRTAKGGSIGGGAETTAISFFDKKVSVIPQSTNTDGNAYYTSLYQTLPLIFKSLDSAFDISFIDTTAGNDPLTMEALKLADVIVVCLPQEEWILNYFFSKYDLKHSKIFYLFGNYDQKSNRNLGTLLKNRKYRGKLNSKNTAFVEHDIDYANALNSSDLVAFFQSGILSKKNPNHEFFASVHDATRKLLTFAGVVPRK